MAHSLLCLSCDPSGSYPVSLLPVLPRPLAGQRRIGRGEKVGSQLSPFSACLLAFPVLTVSPSTQSCSLASNDSLQTQDYTCSCFNDIPSLAFHPEHTIQSSSSELFFPSSPQSCITALTIAIFHSTLVQSLRFIYSFSIQYQIIEKSPDEQECFMSSPQVTIVLLFFLWLWKTAKWVSSRPKSIV